MQTWKDKANRVIAAMCRESYEQANRLPNGAMRKRHVPYSVPLDAQTLVECLRRDDEERAKAVFQRHAFGAINK